MTGLTESQALQDIVILMTAVGGAILYAKNRIPQKNVQELTALATTYERRIQALEDEATIYHKTIIENGKAIADLQGQVKVYKELPLRELADGIKSVARTNAQILDTLKSSALIAADDKIVESKTTKTVKVSKEQANGTS